MTNKLFYFDLDNAKRVNSKGAAVYDQINLDYGSDPNWEFLIGRVTNGSVVGLNLSDAVAWELAMAQDWDEATAPLIKTLNSDIDSSGASGGVVVSPINTRTVPLNTYLAKTEYKTIYGRLKGINAQLKAIYQIRFVVKVWNDVDKSSDPPPEELAIDFYTKTEDDARVNAIVAAIDNTSAKASFDSGDLVADCYTFAHDLGTADVIVQVRNAAGQVMAPTDIKTFLTNSCVIDLTHQTTSGPWTAYALAGGNYVQAPKLLTLTSAPTKTTALADIDATAPVGSYGFHLGYRYQWIGAATVIREAIQDEF